MRGKFETERKPTLLYSNPNYLEILITREGNNISIKVQWNNTRNKWDDQIKFCRFYDNWQNNGTAKHYLEDNLAL